MFFRQKIGCQKAYEYWLQNSLLQRIGEIRGKKFWFRARNRLIIWALCKYAPGLKSFLEVGCGTGFVLSAISKQFPEANIWGSEYLEEGLVYARQRLPKIIFSQMDARNINHESELDALGIFDVLEHIEEDEVVLQQIFKALKPGGIVFITVPQHRRLWSTVDEYACHVRRYTANDLHQKVSRTGYDIIRSTSFVSTLLPAMYLSRFLRRKKTTVNIDAMAELRINPILNKIFELFLHFELFLIRLGISIPVGGSRLLVACKPMLIQMDR